MSVLPAPGEEQPLFPGGGSGPSEATRELVDVEACRIVDRCYERALECLREHRGALEALAGALLQRETLDEADAYEVAGFDRPQPAPAIALSPSSAIFSGKRR